MSELPTGGVPAGDGTAGGMPTGSVPQGGMPDTGQTGAGRQLLGEAYEIVRKIGKGAQAVVYEAVCIEDGHCGLPYGTRVAIKRFFTLHDAESRDKVIARFRNHQQRLNHPGFVRNIEFFIDKPGSVQAADCVVMELAEGQTLRDRLAPLTPGGPPQTMQWEEARDCFGAVIEALGYAASQHIAHRDIKPSNIHLGHDGRIRVLDFDLSIDLDAGVGSLSSGGFAGTLNYMAPEFSRSKFYGDEKSDVFSLCVCFFEALTGRLPYGSFENPFAFVQRFAGDVRLEIPDDEVFMLMEGLAQLFIRGLSMKREGAGARFDFAELGQALWQVRRQRIGTADNCYELVRHIGTGGFSRVFVGRHIATGREVAVKVAKEAQSYDRFLKEGDLLGQLRAADSPHIVRYLDFIAPPGERPALIMELLPDMPEAGLNRRIEASCRGGGYGGLPVEEVLELFDGYLAGLAALHKPGRGSRRSQIYHRDIKPSNLYAPEGHPERARLLDLGAARIDRDSYSVGVPPATYEYAPPEFFVALADNRVFHGSPQGDIYSLGLALYEALTGRPLLPKLPKNRKDALLEALKRAQTHLRRNQSPADFTHPVFTQNPGLDEIILKATAANPRQRYDSAAVFRVALRKIAEQRQAVIAGEEPATEPTGDMAVVQKMLKAIRAGSGEKSDATPTDITGQKTVPAPKVLPPRRSAAQLLARRLAVVGLLLAGAAWLWIEQPDLPGKVWSFFNRPRPGGNGTGNNGGGTNNTETGSVGMGDGGTGSNEPVTGNGSESEPSTVEVDLPDLPKGMRVEWQAKDGWSALDSSARLPLNATVTIRYRDGDHVAQTTNLTYAGTSLEVPMPQLVSWRWGDDKPHPELKVGVQTSQGFKEVAPGKTSLLVGTEYEFHFMPKSDLYRCAPTQTNVLLSMGEPVVRIYPPEINQIKVGWRMEGMLPPKAFIEFQSADGKNGWTHLGGNQLFDVGKRYRCRFRFDPVPEGQAAVWGQREFEAGGSERLVIKVPSPVSLLGKLMVEGADEGVKVTGFRQKGETEWTSWQPEKKVHTNLTWEVRFSRDDYLDFSRDAELRDGKLVARAPSEEEWQNKQSETLQTLNAFEGALVTLTNTASACQPEFFNDKRLAARFAPTDFKSRKNQERARELLGTYSNHLARLKELQDTAVVIKNTKGGEPSELAGELGEALKGLTECGWPEETSKAVEQARSTIAVRAETLWLKDEEPEQRAKRLEMADKFIGGHGETLGKYAAGLQRKLEECRSVCIVRFVNNSGHKVTFKRPPISEIGNNQHSDYQLEKIPANSILNVRAEAVGQPDKEPFNTQIEVARGGGVVCSIKAGAFKDKPVRVRAAKVDDKYTPPKPNRLVVNGTECPLDGQSEIKVARGRVKVGWSRADHSDLEEEVDLKWIEEGTTLPVPAEARWSNQRNDNLSKLILAEELEGKKELGELKSAMDDLSKTRFVAEEYNKRLGELQAKWIKHQEQAAIERLLWECQISDPFENSSITRQKAGEPEPPDLGEGGCLALTAREQAHIEGSGIGDQRYTPRVGNSWGDLLDKRLGDHLNQYDARLALWLTWKGWNAAWTSHNEDVNKDGVASPTTTKRINDAKLRTSDMVKVLNQVEPEDELNKVRDYLANNVPPKARWMLALLDQLQDAPKPTGGWGKPSGTINTAMLDWVMERIGGNRP